MKDYKVTTVDYQEYLTDLKGAIFKILPLYEESNDYLIEYIDNVIDEVIYVKVVIDELPHAVWYVKTLSNLTSLRVKANGDNHNSVKKKVLNTVNIIQKELLELNKDAR